MTRIINLYGGPGTGKSTSAAYLFARLKMQGSNAELVREYVKDWAWDGRKVNDYDQIYLLGKQVRRESMLYGKVDDIVTDSPVMLSAYYAAKFSPPDISHGVQEIVKGFYQQAKKDGHRHEHIFLCRSKAYNPKGRFQTEDEAKKIDEELANFLLKLDVNPTWCSTEMDDLARLLNISVP